MYGLKRNEVRWVSGTDGTMPSGKHRSVLSNAWGTRRNARRLLTIIIDIYYVTVNCHAELFMKSPRRILKYGLLSQRVDTVLRSRGRHDRNVPTRSLREKGSILNFIRANKSIARMGYARVHNGDCFEGWDYCFLRTSLIGR